MEDNDNNLASRDQPEHEFTESDEIDEANMPKSQSLMKQIFQNALVHVPPNLNSAMIICRSQRLTADDVNEMRFTGAYMTIDKFMLFLLPAYPEFISVLACLVEHNLITNVQDTGALLLYVATERKHISLATALITRNASIAGLQHPVNQHDKLELNDSIPFLNNEINMTIFHTALHSRVLVLDIVQNLLKLHGPVLRNQSNIFTRQMLGQKVSPSSASSPPPPMSSSSSSSSDTGIDRSIYYSGIEEAAVYPKWLISMVQSMQKHLPDVEGQKINQALIRLLQDSPIINIRSQLLDTNSNGNGKTKTKKMTNTKNENNDNEANKLPLLSVHYKLPVNLSGNYAVLQTIDTRYAQVIANGLSTLLLRLILEAPGATYNPNVTKASSASSSTPSPVSIDEELFPHRLSRIFAQDGLGRTPLHIAAMTGNVAAVRILLHYIAKTELPSNFRSPSSIPAMKIAPHLTMENIARITPPGRIEAYIMTNDIRGLNALDYACIYGHDEVVDLFIFGPGQPTNTEKHILSCSRWTNNLFDPSTNKVIKHKPSPIIPLSDEARTNKGGWGRPVKVNPMAQAGIEAIESLSTTTVPGGTKTKINCQVDMVDADISARQFFEFYYIPNRPVVIRGLALNWPQRMSWKQHNLLATSDNVKFLASHIPYSTSFGIGKNDADDGNSKGTMNIDSQGNTSPVTSAKGSDASTAPRNKPVTIGEYINALYGCSDEWTSYNNDTAPVDPLLCTALGFLTPSPDSVSPHNNASSSTSPLYIFDSPLVASTRGINVNPTTVKTAKELIKDVNYVPNFIHYEISKDGFSATYRVPPSAEDANTDESISSSSSYYTLVQNYPTGPKPQFYLGSPGTGAPMHVHKDAWNALIYGQKRWFLLPPALSLYSTVPASEWVQDLARLRQYRTSTESKGKSSSSINDEYTLFYKSFPFSFLQDQLDNEILQCTQEAGDVMYVPHGWGHAVLNTQTSIGVAVEFSTLFG